MRPIGVELGSLLQAAELLRMGVATGLAAQLLALLAEGQLQADAAGLGGADNLVAGDFDQVAVGRDGLLLHRGVFRHALQRLRWGP